MSELLAAQVMSRLEHLSELYHRLVLVVGPSGAGKTAALQTVAERLGVGLINFNLELSWRLLDLTGRQRALRLPQVLQDTLGTDAPVVLLDNIAMLFDVSLQQGPLRLLQGLSRSRTVVAVRELEGTA